MKGVVRPQQAPTARKLSTQRQIGGEAGVTIVVGGSGSIAELGFTSEVEECAMECTSLVKRRLRARICKALVYARCCL
jgi:1-aminocyclopropane-1-carboxylate deaminase/D-cysteine desulfhydrase-like pyridoxal-dependent ACC family enzyme